MAIVFPYGIFAFDALQLAMEARLVNPGAVRGCVGGEATLTDHSLRQGVAMFATVPFQNGTVANLMSLIAPGLLTYLSYSMLFLSNQHGWIRMETVASAGCTWLRLYLLPNAPNNSDRVGNSTKQRLHISIGAGPLMSSQTVMVSYFMLCQLV